MGRFVPVDTNRLVSGTMTSGTIGIEAAVDRPSGNGRVG